MSVLFTKMPSTQFVETRPSTIQSDLPEGATSEDRASPGMDAEANASLSQGSTNDYYHAGVIGDPERANKDFSLPTKLGSLSLPSNSAASPAVFSVPTVLRGPGNDRSVYVGASINDFVRLSPELKRVRQNGINSQADIQHAIDYLIWLNPSFEKVFQLIKEKNIPIKLGSEKLTYSYARVTFHGSVDRNSPDFGREIVIEKGATPDILLHEVMHVLPLVEINHLSHDLADSAIGVPELSGIVGDLVRSLSQLSFPPVVPSEPFRIIRETILENIRLNETISFSFQVLSYQLERNRRIAPVFNNEMMSNLDSAWNRNQFQGIRTTFPNYLPHYEERLGLTSILLALIVKVEGRTTLSDEEFQRITKISEEKLPLQGQLEYFQNYLNKYVREKLLDVPSDFYSLSAIVLRQAGGLEFFSTEGLVRAIDGVFAELEELEKIKICEDIPESKILKPEETPPEESQGKLALLFDAYSGVVLRVLENPPASFSREELSSLIGYIRMAHPRVILDLTDRIKIYLGVGFEDLRVALGLVLYEKGFLEQGKNLVLRSLTPENLSEVLPVIAKVMDAETTCALIQGQAHKLRDEHHFISEKFQAQALDQFQFEEANLQKAAADLFSSPELFDPENWNRVGVWFFSSLEDVDSRIDDEYLFQFAHGHFQRGIFDRYLKREKAFYRALVALRGNPHISAAVKETAEKVWADLKEKNRISLDHFLNFMKLGDDYSLLPLLADRSTILGFYSKEELEDLFRHYSAEQKQRIITLVEINSNHPWSYPEEVIRLANELTDQIIEKVEGYENHTILLKDLLDATIRKYKNLEHSENTERLRSCFRAMIAAFFQGGLPPLLYKRDFVDNSLFGFRQSDEFIDTVQQRIGFDAPYADRLETYMAADFAAGDFDDDIYEKTQALSLICRAIHLGDAQVEEYFRQGLKLLREICEYPFDVDKRILEVIDDFLAPNAIYLFFHAQRMGFTEIAEAYLQFLFEKIPERYPPETEYQGEEDDDPLIGTRFGQRSLFFRKQEQLRWTFQMEGARLEAEQNNEIENWLERFQREIHRGSAMASTSSLHFFVVHYEEKQDLDILEKLLRMMIQKSLASLDSEDITQTMRDIQNSPLSDSVKDILFEDFVRKLLSLITSFRGIDLSFVSYLQVFFPWKKSWSYFDRDVPHYPRTEKLLLDQLAQISELVDPQKNKDDNLRLRAFAVAGLPLQRYPVWIENLFFVDARSPGIQALGSRKNDRKTYSHLGLPHPYDVPALYKSEEAKAFIQKEGEKILSVLNGNAAEPAEAVLALLARLFGSELRFLLSENKNQTSVGFSQSNFGVFIFNWLGVQYKRAPRSAHLEKVQDLLFSAGPAVFRRLDQALSMMDWPMSREEKRTIFTQATRHLLFSSRVKKHLQSLQDGEEKKEIAYYRLLLSIHYEKHPGHMISNFLLGKLEADPKLLQEYKIFCSSLQTVNSFLIAEVGLASLESKRSAARNWARLSSLERFELYLNSLRFLREYIDVERRDHYVDEYAFHFDTELVKKNLGRFAVYIDRYREIGLQLESSSVFLLEGILENILEEVDAILQVTGWNKKLSEDLDKKYDDDFFSHSSVKRTYHARPSDFFVENLKRAISEAESTYREMILADHEDKLEDVELPDFIPPEEGLERDLYLWTLASIDPEQRRIAQQKMSEAQTDSQRKLIFGRAAHLEKIAQIASVHPAVSPELRRECEPFQEDVPHRDQVDVSNTFLEFISYSFDVPEDSRISLGRPLKEGTIGGVYLGLYQGQEIVFKIIPNGKRNDILDSLRVVKAVRRFLWASHYQRPGARAVDDFLAFYERTMIEELDLSREPENARLLQEVLPENFIIPEYMEGFSSPSVVMMEPLYSKRLKDLTPDERKNLFFLVDDQLIPAMLYQGVIHYDLHPGNIGLHENGDIVLYDVGRVQKLSDEEKNNLTNFYMAMTTSNTDELPALLRKMGTVRDEKQFKKIGELFASSDVANPMKALETIYPKLADYGYCLNDNYVKVLLLFMTWEGTKNSFALQS